MNEWSNDQAQAEGWTLNTQSNVIQAYGWEFMGEALNEHGAWVADESQRRAIAHVEARARAGSAYHIEALARHYFRE